MKIILNIVVTHQTTIEIGSIKSIQIMKTGYCKCRNFRAVHIFVHFAHDVRCAKI